MQGEGIRNLKLVHASIFVVLILLQCCNHSLSLYFNNISSGVVGHRHIAKVPKVIRCTDRERKALLAFKGLADTNNSLSSWGSEAPRQDCCASWEGVSCDKYTGHVVKLDLNSYYLGGQISSQVGNLTHLQYLDLSWNYFNNVKNLNSWLPHLSSITYLDLSYNNLSNVSDWLEAINKLPKLTNLILCWCGLASPAIHSNTLLNINSSKSLTHVYLVSNQLTSPSIFLWLSNYNASLVHLYLSNNSITGLIPHVFGNMRPLSFLGLGDNHLAGSLPNLANCSSLETLDLSCNQLSGTITETYFSQLSKLRNLGLSSNSLALNFHFDWIPPFQLHSIDLGSCMLGPHFPKWLQTHKSCFKLDISNAGISDVIPSWFWGMLSRDHEIDYIDLSNNQIRGIIPNSTFEISSFPREVNLSWNQLEGPVPSFLSKASSLDLSNNKLSGLVSFLCPMTPINASNFLTFLDLSTNQAYEELPDCWTHFDNLVFLDLSDNAFFGKIPTTIGSLYSIETLKLSNNGFVGELPSSLKNCTSLTVFDVGENKLSGLIPEWLGVGLPNLIILILRSNHFYGSIPSQLCYMGRIQILDFSMNNLSGNIPKCLNCLTNLAQKGSSSLTINHYYNLDNKGQNFSAKTYDDEEYLIWKGIMSKYKSTLGLVKSIHLSGNQLTGEIPSEITDLVGLVSLNLSRNNLIGQITPKIGKLQSLDSLDLSNNQIHGMIPTSLFRISGLGKLDLSNNNLSGKIPMGSQLQNYDPYVFAGNDLLCGIPLQQLCSPEETSSEEESVFRDQIEEKDGLITSGFYVSLALGFVVGFWGVCGSLIFIRSWRYTYYKLLNFVYDWLYVRVVLIRQRRMINE